MEKNFKVGLADFLKSQADYQKAAVGPPSPEKREERKRLYGEMVKAWFAFQPGGPQQPER